MREVAIPNRAPIAEHTPNACHSMNCLNLFILQYKKFTANIYKQFFLKILFNVTLPPV